MSIAPLLSDLLKCETLRSIHCILADVDKTRLNNKQLEVVYYLQGLNSVRGVHEYCKDKLGFVQKPRLRSKIIQKETA